MDRFERYDASRFLGSPREPLVSPEYVWRSGLAARLAGIREPGRGLSLCAVGWSPSCPAKREWHRAAYATPQGSERAYPWGEEPPDASRGNFDLQRWDPTPTSAFPAGRSAYGVADLMGNGWEWTRTVFAPFAGFEAFPFYPGYSANFFDGKHYVLKGGSARTAQCMLRRSFRNWFQTHYPFIYSGFRCIKH